MKGMVKMKKYKIGVFGCNIRAEQLSKDFLLLGSEIVAACETREDRKEPFLKVVGNDCVWYTDFDEFIKHDMDAVLLTNFFPEHAPYAVKCLERGIHVLSECISNGTMAEGVELIRAAEKSDAVYMLAENYPQMVFNLEMQRVCKSGTLGKILYAEGEYNHPGDPKNTKFKKWFNYYPEHWRNFLPRTYYITHSLGPVMRATGATPKRVTAMAAAGTPAERKTGMSHVLELAACITTYNDDNSIFRVVANSAFGGHHNAYRICGTKGQIENVRGMGNKVMLRYNAWDKPEDKPEISLYEAEWKDKDEEIIESSGHGGGDFITVRMFLECIEQGKQPEHPFDVHSAVTMSSVAILAHRSALEGGMPYDIPDFHDEEQRKKYENDRLSPFYGPDGSAPTLPCCPTKPDYKPDQEQIDKYMEMINS